MGLHARRRESASSQHQQWPANASVLSLAFPVKHKCTLITLHCFSRCLFRVTASLRAFCRSLNERHAE